jgi:hypothetical protein
MTRLLTIPACVLFSAFVLLPTLASAQLGVPGIESSVNIDMSPTHPAPGQSVHLVLKSTAINLSSSDIVWRSNGSIIAHGTGIDSTDIQAGGLGSQTSVDVTVSGDGVTAQAHVVLAPVAMDILVDSDSYVPPFFHGAAVPSAGTTLILQAFPHFKTATAPNDLIYTWRRNGEVIAEVSGRGKSSVRIPAPHLFGADTISIDAHSPDGTLSAEASVTVSSVDPRLELYQDHPLYGITYDQALQSTSFISESEMTFIAVPYFAQSGGVHDPQLSYAWHVNGSAVAQSTVSPSEITINAQQSTGQALLDVEVTHATNYYLDARGSWNLTFSNGTASDQFHTGQ